MYDAKQIAQNIESILDGRHISTNKFLNEAGLGRTTIANMKSGSMPSVDKIAKIAETLGVSVDFLLGIEKAPDGISIRSVIIERVKSLSDHQAELLLAFLEGLVSG